MANPTPKKLVSRLVSLLPSAVPFEGVAYRSSTPKYATKSDLLTGEGSRLWGGRWNPVGVAVVYAALTPETAFAESLAHARYYGEPIEDSMPMTFVAFRFNLKKVLDLRDAKVRRQFRVPFTKLLAIDWRMELWAGLEPMTQALGRAAHSAHWESLVVPSAADPAGHNLLVFPDRMLVGSSMSILNPDKLGTT